MTPAAHRVQPPPQSDVSLKEVRQGTRSELRLVLDQCLKLLKDDELRPLPWGSFKYPPQHREGTSRFMLMQVVQFQSGPDSHRYFLPAFALDPMPVIQPRAR